MAFDQGTRNRLARFVSDARILLTEEFTRQLQNEYGLDPDSGEITGLEKLTALDDMRRETARILRETLDYYLAGKTADAKNRKDVLQRIVREQAFTILNRLCALRMAESRGILIESIAQGYQSKGFQLYDRLAGTGLGEKGDAYRSYLFSLFDEFAVDLRVLFDRFSPQGRLFPRQAALINLLELINDPEIDQLWVEDETIGWMYQYFNTKEERQEMRAASSTPRNSRELAVRNQFFTPRYVVEFLTDNTLGRIWYEMTKGETSLKDSSRYLVRKKHPFFLQEAEEIPQPFYPDRAPWGDPDLAGEMWIRPNPEFADIGQIFRYALSVGGYDYAKDHLGKECADLANQKIGLFRETGKWNGSFEELRCCLFFEQRRYHHFGEDPKGEDERAVFELYRAICERWDWETEFILHRSIKDPRELKMLDPACGSMHFGLYAFDLFEQIYSEAWDLEEKLGKDALWRLADLEPLHDTYIDRDTFLRDVPRLIIERNIHGVDIDPRAVQISGLSLWLRAQKSWQAQGVKLQERPQIQHSNIVCAEPMTGDQVLLDEFLETLKEDRLEELIRRVLSVPIGKKVRGTKTMADALASLMRTVWHEMELAGEVGTLLKSEETLRDAIAKAKTVSEERAPLFSVLDYSIGDFPKQDLVQEILGEEQNFWTWAEKLVLSALKDFSELVENDGNYLRRLFTHDASQGFAFLDLCRKKYDVVLMNPPFGTGCLSFEYAIHDSELRIAASKNLAWAFVNRALSLASEQSYVGGIVDRTIFQKSSYEHFRETILFKLSIRTYVDLGSGILDANVFTSCFTIKKMSTNFQPTFITDLRTIRPENKADILYNIVAPEIIDHSAPIYWRSIEDFRIVPFLSFSYWIHSDTLTKVFTEKTLEKIGFEIGGGLQCNDVFRFLRMSWEVDPESIENSFWVGIYNGGEYSKYFASQDQLVNWSESGIEIKENIIRLGNSPSRHVVNEKLYLRAGIAGGERGEFFDVHCLPKGLIFSNEGRAFFHENLRFCLFLLGYLNTLFAQQLVNIYCGQHKGAEYLKRLPIPSEILKYQDEIAELALKLVRHKYEFQSSDEVTRRFGEFGCFIGYLSNSTTIDEVHNKLSLRWFELSNQIKLLEHRIDIIVKDALGFQVVSDMEDSGWVESPPPIDNPLNATSNGTSLTTLNGVSAAVLSFMIGLVFGRWDISLAMKEKTDQEFFDPFLPLPFSSRGMLQNLSKISVEQTGILSDHPIQTSHRGIIIDDIGHPDDIEISLRKTFRIIWPNNSELIEQEICHILETLSIRDYFQNPNLFFADHFKRYSKSRRQAPIYWPLSTPSNSYTLWLYYHRLSDQTLFTCVNDFVDPKLKQVAEEASRLRLKKGRSAADEKELERLTDFERELKDFRDELLRVAKFWKPNLNDGVQITAAPLWKLFQHRPWQKKLKETWESLEAGEYDWAHLAYNVWPERVREKCKTDKSLAIAHDLEHLYVEPKTSLKKEAGRKKDSDMEEMFNED
jgi:hypothetical protein